MPVENQPTRWTRESGARPERNLWLAMKRGMKCRCPACGEGKIFSSFLRIAKTCPSCHEELYHHRADDLPAYLVIVIVGHIIVPVALAIEKAWAPDMLLQMAFYVPLSLLMSLLLLPPTKGAVVGLQWALRMHGFDENDPERTKEPSLASS